MSSVPDDELVALLQGLSLGVPNSRNERDSELRRFLSADAPDLFEGLAFQFPIVLGREAARERVVQLARLHGA